MSSGQTGNGSPPETGMPTQQILPVCGKLLNESSRAVSKEFVFDVYDQIAPHFSHTRYVIYELHTERFIDIKCGQK
jgi:hypothetical protein